MAKKKGTTTYSREAAVHRKLERHDQGIDVKRTQHGISTRAESLKLPFLEVKEDGHVGPRTEHAASLILFAMGVYGPTIKRVRAQHELSEYAQRLLRDTAHRNPAMVALSLKRRGTVKKWRQAHEDRTPVQEGSAIADLVALIAKGMAYAWGGGHVNPADSGPGDCSWLASREVQHFDPSIPTGTTYTLAGEGSRGFGKILTLMIKNIAGEPDESHVIARWELDDETIAKYGLKKWICPDGFIYSECGGSDNPTPGNGPTFFIPGEGMGLTVAQRVAEFSEHRHVKGF